MAEEHDEKYDISVDLISKAFRLPHAIVRDEDQIKTLMKLHEQKADRKFHVNPKSIVSSGPKSATNRSSDYSNAASRIEKTRNENTNPRNGFWYVRDVIFGQAKKMLAIKVETKFLNFLNIVDIDDDSFKEQITLDLASRFGDGDIFRYITLGAIFFNTILIGLQMDKEWDLENTQIVNILDRLLTGIFVMEIVLKWYYGFFNFWKSGWNVFDFSIVALQLLGPSLAFVGTSRILRILRVLKAFRALRSVALLQGFQLIVTTITRSIPDMFNIILLLFIVMFIFAVIGVTLFQKYDTFYFGDIGGAFYTLFICLTQHGWIRIFDSLESQGQFTAAAIYFASFIIIGAFVFTNLIVAVVVTNLEKAYRSFKEQKARQHRDLKSNFTKTSSSVKDTSRATRIVTLNEISPSSYEKQIPFEVPDFEKLDHKKVEKYLTILSVMEENLNEFALLKDSLEAIVRDLKTLKQNVEVMEEELAEPENAAASSAEPAAADVVSRMLAMSKIK